MLGGPSRPPESQLHTRDAPSPDAQAGRAEPPPVLTGSWACVAWWQPPPQAALPSGEAAALISRLVRGGLVAGL